jgi:hypothetical protein
VENTRCTVRCFNGTRITNRCTRAAGACFARSFYNSTLSLARGRVNSTVMLPRLFDAAV